MRNSVCLRLQKTKNASEVDKRPRQRGDVSWLRRLLGLCSLNAAHDGRAGDLEVSVEGFSIPQDVELQRIGGFHVLLIQAAVPNAWFPEAQWAILAPAWSLSHEWQFYLIAPRLRKAAFSPFGLMSIAILAVGAARLAARMKLGLEWSLLTTLPLFLVGILTYRIHERVASRPEIKLADAMLPLCGLTAFAIIANWRFLPIGAWTLVYGTIIAADRLECTRSGAILVCLSGLLKNRIFLWLGSISYPIYLLHWPFMIIVLAVTLKLRPGVTSMQAFGVLASTLPVLLWFSSLVHRAIGLPAANFGKRLRTDIRPYPETIANSPSRAASTSLSS